MRIESDFNDYYDFLQNRESNIVYDRNSDKQLDRGRALLKLREMGVKTLELCQVNHHPYTVENVVVYTDTKAHHGLGKKVMDISSALCSYQTYPSAEWFIRQNGITLKILTIGKRKFSLYFRNADPMSIDKGFLIDLKEIPGGYDKSIGVPIFSIDYIAHNNEWIATDLNTVERLADYGISSLIKPQDIITEIKGALNYYNRQEKKE